MKNLIYEVSAMHDACIMKIQFKRRHKKSLDTISTHEPQ